MMPTVAASIDLVVQIGMEHDGSRRIREIVALPGRVESGVVETADIFTSVDGKLVRAQGYPRTPIASLAPVTTCPACSPAHAPGRDGTRA
jgi:pilus assembly protein CpaF